MPGNWELNLATGLLSIDGHEIEDIFDYQFYVEEEELSASDREAGRRRMGAGNREGSGRTAWD